MGHSDAPFGHPNSRGRGAIAAPWIAVAALSIVAQSACGEDCRDVAGHLAPFRYVDLVRLFEGMLRIEEEPSRLRRVRRSLGLNTSLGPEHAECLADAVSRRLPPWRRPTHKVAIVLGQLRAPELFRLQLKQLLQELDLVVFATWDDEVPEGHWLHGIMVHHSKTFAMVVQQRGDAYFAVEDIPLLTSAKLQDLLARSALAAVERILAGQGVASEVLVLKTRTDVYLPPDLLRQIFDGDYTVAREDIGRPFLRKVWVGCFDALQPFYLPDEVIAASAVDWQQLLWPPATFRPGTSVLGRAHVHVSRWLVPFQPWYPLLFAYRRNAFDLSDKVLEPMRHMAHPRLRQRFTGGGPLPPPWPRQMSSAIIELARLGLLAPEVDRYLVDLLALWYRLLLAYFLVGHPGRRFGAYVVVRGNATASRRPSAVLLEGLRPLPASFGFSDPGVEVLDGSDLRLPGAPDDSGGLAQANAVCRHWAKPIFHLDWARRVLAGDVPDGVSERVARSGALQRSHFATREGHSASVAQGRFQEDLSTRWCRDFYFWAHAESIPWSECCGPGAPDVCFAEGMRAFCCFPAGAFCPAFLSKDFPTYALALLSAFLIGSERRAVRLQTEMEAALRNESSLRAMRGFCHPDAAERALRAERLCDASPRSSRRRRSMEAVCELRATILRQTGALAPRSERGGVVRRLWASTAGRGIHGRIPV